MTTAPEIEAMAFKYAVKNAALHDGKADMGAVVGKLKALFPDLDIKELAGFAQNAVKKTNALSLDQIKSEFAIFEKEGYELKPHEKEAGLTKLDWAENGEPVVTRFAPNPSSVMHFGHLRAAILSAQYAKKYGGKFILRFEDTDPKTKQPLAGVEKQYDIDLKWLGIPQDEIFYQSDRFELYYDFVRKLLAMQKAYVCTCDNDAFKELKKQKKPCPCRELEPKEQLNRFEKMLNHSYKEGQAVLRVKTDLNHPDPSIRDWWAAKIVDKPVHPRKKNTWVWPAYNLACAIDDHLMGVTLILRGQEHSQNATKQKYLYDYFGWKYPHAIHFGRMQLKGFLLSKSKINELMKSGEITSWDDPRLATVQAFRRRGFESAALTELMTEIGPKPQDVQVPLQKLEGWNRKIIDPIAQRIVFLREPIELEVKNAPSFTAKLNRHPEFSEKGFKEYSFKKGNHEFRIEKQQAEELKIGESVQLKQAYLIKILEKTRGKITAEFVGTEFRPKSVIVHWLVPNRTTKVEVTMSDAKQLTGMAEDEVLKYKAGSHLQFEKFGYVVVDQTGKKEVLVYFTQA
ncbi:MAG: glutamate--tRNA ligase [Candidatus Micrarchaeota archaeon]